MKSTKTPILIPNTSPLASGSVLTLLLLSVLALALNGLLTPPAAAQPLAPPPAIHSFTVGQDPIDVCFDGANIWAVNSASNSVTKLRASDGFNLGTFPLGSYPIYVIYDGANIWVSNEGDNTVSKLQASDGTLLGTFPVTAPNGVAFDGAN